MRRFDKKWKTISLATLLALGGASLIGDHRSVHASVTPSQSTQHVAHVKTPKQITPNMKFQVSSPVLHQLSSTKKSINRLAQKQRADRAKFTYVSANNQYTQTKAQPQQVPTVIKDLTDALNQSTAQINQSARRNHYKPRQNKRIRKQNRRKSINLDRLSNKLTRSEQHINQQAKLYQNQR